MITSRRSAAFSASSRLFDLNGEANRVRKKQSSAIIAADVRRFGHVINKDEVFGTHSGGPFQSCQSGSLRIPRSFLTSFQLACDGWRRAALRNGEAA